MTGFSKQVRTTVRKRSAGWCERCGAEPATEYHHRRPRGMGGTQRLETNLPSACLHLCVDCHRDIELYRRRALESGWLVAQNMQPLSVAVIYRGQWVLLDDNGTWKTAAE